MDENVREQVLSALVEAARMMGSDNYEAGIQKAKKLIELAYNGAQAMETRDGLRKLLDSIQVTSPQEEQMLLLVATFLPHIIRAGMRWSAKKMTNDLPALGAGRPSTLSVAESHQVVDAILAAQRKKIPLEVAKRRVAQQFNYGRRTVERIWSNRASLPEQGMTVQDAIRMLLQSD